MTLAETKERYTPTVDQMRRGYHSDLQLVGLHVLSEAERSSRPADYIAAMLETIRDCYHPREVTYLTEFIMHHAEARGLLDAAKIPA
jgi:hypothetical protein